MINVRHKIINIFTVELIKNKIIINSVIFLLLIINLIKIINNTLEILP